MIVKTFKHNYSQKNVQMINLTETEKEIIKIVKFRRFTIRMVKGLEYCAMNYQVEKLKQQRNRRIRTTGIRKIYKLITKSLVK